MISMTNSQAKSILANYVLNSLDTSKYPLVYEAIMKALMDMEKMEKIRNITKEEGAKK